MSTGADCVLEEREPGRWWYRLQRWPYGESPDYDTHGPFPSEDACMTHLHKNYANPGGYSTVDHESWTYQQQRRVPRETSEETTQRLGPPRPRRPR